MNRSYTITPTTTITIIITTTNVVPPRVHATFWWCKPTHWYFKGRRFFKLKKIQGFFQLCHKCNECRRQISHLPRLAVQGLVGTRQQHGHDPQCALARVRYCKMYDMHLQIPVLQKTSFIYPDIKDNVWQQAVHIQQYVIPRRCQRQ